MCFSINFEIIKTSVFCHFHTLYSPLWQYDNKQHNSGSSSSMTIWWFHEDIYLCYSHWFKLNLNAFITISMMTILRHKEVTQMTYTPILIYYEFKKIYKEGKNCSLIYGKCDLNGRLSVWICGAKNKTINYVIHVVFADGCGMKKTFFFLTFREVKVCHFRWII